MSIVNESALPIGFRMELSMDFDAMEKFTNLSSEQRNRLIEESRGIQTKNEMHQFVAAIHNNSFS